MFKISQFIDCSATAASEFLMEERAPWDLIKNISKYATYLINQRTTECAERSSKIHPRAIIDGDVFIGFGTVVDANAIIKGPVFIGNNCYIGSNSLVRPGTVILDNSKVGFSCEIKSSLILEGATISHFCFVGDSIIGREVNLASSTTTANFPHSLPMKDDGTRIIINYGEYGKVDVGLRHMGAVIGDYCRLGCHTVLSPGTLVGKGVHGYPNIVLRGYIKEGVLVKQKYDTEFVMRSDSYNVIDLKQTFSHS